jgi:hypothetical protein
MTARRFPPPGLTKENPAAGKLWRGEVSEMNRRPDRMLASIRFWLDALL